MWRYIVLFLFLYLGKQDFVIAQQNHPFLTVVKQYADNVLQCGKDRWSSENTPLLADGINVLTRDPVEWIYTGEDGPDARWIIHDLANQQNLFRVLTGLTNLVGDPRYKEAAEKSIRYHFEHLLDESGLLYWGGHQFVDLRTLEPVEYYPFTPSFGQKAHEFKNHFPFYELMWEVDSLKTKRFIEAYWNAHILDWYTLDMNRHGQYGKPMGALWDHSFGHPDPFVEGKGLTFLNAGSDLVYAGSLLYFLNGGKGSLKWARLLANQYVKARHPDTGLGVHQYSKMKRTEEPPEEGPLPNKAKYGDRAENQFGQDFPDVANEGWVLFNGHFLMRPFLMLMELSEKLGAEGQNFLQPTIDGLKAFVRYAYIPEQNQFRPLWADGTDVTGYEYSRSGYFGKEGTVLKPYDANSLDLFTYARAFRLCGDLFLWEMMRSMFRGMDFGDIGVEPGKEVDLRMNTRCADPEVIFALLELNRALDKSDYLKFAQKIGENILDKNYHYGFFLPDENHVNANFNSIEPLALLSLVAALQDRPEAVPVYSGGRSYIHGYYGDKGRTYDRQAIWDQIKTTK